MSGGSGTRIPTVPASWVRALILPVIVLAWLAILVILIWLLSHFTHTLLLVALAAVLAFAFTPLANFLGRWLPRTASIGLAYVLGLAVVLGFGAYVIGATVAQVTSLAINLPQYGAQVKSLQPSAEALLAPLGVPADWLDTLVQDVVGQVQVFGGAVARDLIPQLAAFFGTLVDMILVLILSIYLCSSGSRIANWFKTQTPGEHTRMHAQLLVAVVTRVVGGYVRGVLTLALLIGVLVGVGLAVLGVPYAVLLGVLAFFMEFVPILGVFISGAAAIIIAVIQFREVLRPLLVLVYFVFVHVIEGDVVGPRIMGRAVGIHPATGLIALVAGTEVFGVWGALFAAPVAGLLQSVLVAAWLELRGGKPREVLQAVARETDDHAAQAVAAATESETPSALTRPHPPRQ